MRSIPAIALFAGLAACSGSSTAAAPVAADSGYVSVPGARLFYRSVGSHDPIIVVNGGPGMDHSYLLPGMLGLARTHRLIFYDQRGTGRTEGDVNASTISLDRYLADIDALRDSLELARPVLLGRSWGGFVAMRYAVKYPEQLRALILMNTEEPGKRYEAEATRVIRGRLTPEDNAELARLAQLPGRSTGDTAALNPTLRIYFRATFADRALSPQLRFGLDPRTARNMSQVATLVMGPLGQYDYWNDVATIEVPTLIVHGAQDVMPLAMPRDLGKSIPLGQVAMIENAGHFPYIEKPAETFAAINTFLAGVKPLPATTPDGKVSFTTQRRP
jgi:proline iminopeptidase